MSGHLLTLNAGSSSLKFALFEGNAPSALLSGLVEGLGTRPRLVIRDAHGSKLTERVWSDDAVTGDGPLNAPVNPNANARSDAAGPAPGGVHAALAVALDWLSANVPGLAVRAVGHRVVHGGVHFAAPVAIDDTVFAQLEKLVPLAPLHQPHNLDGVRAARAHFPSVPQVACFDTAFHRGHPFVHDVFALPRAFYDEGVRRYGFHGLSYEYVANRLADIDPDAARGRAIVAHLGSGVSMCALLAGRSHSSSMGFTALDGLPMGTRPGQIDPGVLLWLMTEKGMDAAALSDLLYKHSGLKGLSGVSNDMRDLHASDSPAAREAVDYFIERIRREIGGLAAAIGGLDALVFTAGIGENDALVRERACETMQWMGLSIDPAANATHGAGRGGLVSTPGARVRVWVIPTNEELMIARHVMDVIKVRATG